MTNVVRKYEMATMAAMQKEIPDFRPGDTLLVQLRIKEGERERQQAFEGVCIQYRHRGLNSSFTVRKISYGEGVERVLPLYSPLIASITVKSRGDVRRSKLYYLRDRRGKAARIREKIIAKAPKNLNEANNAAEDSDNS
jgi:large subunit ribosomal protein L19